MSGININEIKSQAEIAAIKYQVLRKLAVELGIHGQKKKEELVESIWEKVQVQQEDEVPLNGK
jgi:hypothetical protein